MKRSHSSRYERGHGMPMMGLDLIPIHLRQRFRFDEREYACAILAGDFPDEFSDILDCLDAFSLRRSDIATPGGPRSQVPRTIDTFLWERGWQERSLQIDIKVDEKSVPIPTHKIDNFKNRIGVEVEWNNKTEFYDRDLNNFRLLRELRVLLVGVIITRLTELQMLFNSFGRGSSYGNSTTHWDKLVPKVHGGRADAHYGSSGWALTAMTPPRNPS
jgi:restriction endonuclease BglII